MAQSSGPIAREELEGLLASLAHELRTPLTVIDSAVGLLRRSSRRPERFEEVVAALERNVALMTLIVGRFRTLRLSRESLRPERAPTDLAMLVRSTVDDLRRNILKHHLASVGAPGQLTAEVDGMLVRELLYNLLSNAAKFSPAGGEVVVGLSAPRDGAAELVVQDRGDGVAPEDAELIFERFGRADDSVPGLGVGLYLAREIARAHGGDLVLDPSPDGGARFVATIPTSAQIQPRNHQR